MRAFSSGLISFLGLAAAILTGFFSSLAALLTSDDRVYVPSYLYIGWPIFGWNACGGVCADAAAAAITTPFMGAPGLITGECKVKDGYSYLAITVNADPADPRADDIPGDGSPNWGLHTVDLSITQESLIDVVRSQATAFVGLQD